MVKTNIYLNGNKWVKFCIFFAWGIGGTAIRVRALDVFEIGQAINSIEYKGDTEYNFYIPVVFVVVVVVVFALVLDTV